MAAPTNTFLSTAAIGNREDLSDIIYRITPTLTPFINMAGKGTATNTLHEWQTQDLAAASGSNAQAEGDDATFIAATPTVRLTNRTQISTKAVVVSGTQINGMNPAGRKNELNYQVMLKGLELRRDMETAICANDTLTAGATRVARGLRGWLVDNVNHNGSTLASYTANTGYTAGTQRAFTEAQVKDVLQKCYTAGGEPDTIMVPPAAKQTFSTFTGNATRNIDADEKKLQAAIDVYVSDFGQLKVLPNRFMPTRDVYVLQSDKWSIDYLRPMQPTELAKTGDADKRMILVEYTVTARAPKANAAIYDIL